MSNLINYIEFGATDMAATQEFYESAFGWVFSNYGPSYMGFKEPEVKNLNAVVSRPNQHLVQIRS
jgi:predicted enzyme related to lactoylglutathione lyase